MLHALFRKARADVVGRPFQTTLIFLVVTVAATSLTLGATIRQSASGAFDRYFTEANGAHVWFKGASDPSSLEPIGDLQGVVATAGPFPGVGFQSILSASNVDVPAEGSADLRLADPTGRHGPAPLELVGMPAELPEVSRPVLTEGRWLAPGGLAEIVVDLGTAHRWGIETGDKVDIIAEQGTLTLEVVGVAVSASRPPYPRVDPTLGYALLDGLARFQPDPETWNWRYGVRIDDPDDTAGFISRAKKAYPAGETITASSWRQVQDDFRLGTIAYVAPLSVLGVFMVVAVGFATVNAISANVLAHVRDIGILKAIGFPPGAVTTLILAEHAGVGLLGALAGLGLGMATAPVILESLVRDDVPVTVGEVSFDPMLLAAVVAGTTLVIAAMAFLPAWRAGQVPTVRAIATGILGANDKASRVARLAAWVRMPPVVVLEVKDAFNRPLRSMLSVISLTAAVMTAAFSLGMSATIDAVANDPTVLGGAPWDIQVGRSDVAGGEGTAAVSDAELQRLLNAQPEVEAFTTERSVSFRQAGSPGGAFELRSLAVGGESQKLRYFIPEGRAFAAAGEAIITQRMAEALGVEVGDTIELVVAGPDTGSPGGFSEERSLVLRIVGRYASASGHSKGLIYNLEALQQVFPDVEPGVYSVKLESDADVDAFKAELVRQASGPLAFRTVKSEIGEEVRPILFGLTAALLLIATLNIVTTALFAVRERRRDFGILKAIGMTPGQAAAAVVSGGSVLSLIAVAVGTPLGIVTTRLLFDFFGQQMGIGTGLFQMPSAAVIAAIVPAMFLFSAAGILLPALRASRVKVAEALQTA